MEPACFQYELQPSVAVGSGSIDDPKAGLSVTVEEEAALVARAERENVTVPNLAITSALSETQKTTATERRAALAELMSLHTLLARSSNNIDGPPQVSATGDFPADF